MPNPPTQGRKEAITKGAKALEDSRFFSATSWKAKEMFRELAQAVLDAAYPERPFPWQEAEGEPTEEEWKRVLKPGRYKPVEGVKRQKEGTKGDSASDTERYQQTEGDGREWFQDQRDLLDERAELRARLIAAEQRAETAEREVKRLSDLQGQTAEGRYQDLRSVHFTEVDEQRDRADRLQRECEKLRETLREMKNSAKFLSCGCAFAIPQQVDAVLDAAYPEHSKPNEPIILTEEQAEKYEELVKRRSKPVGTPLPLDPEQTEGKEKLEKAERELADARSQHLLLSNQTLDATQRAEKAEQERDELRGELLTRLHERTYERDQARADRDRLQRECEKLREALGDIAESGKPLNWARDIARDALEKP